MVTSTLSFVAGVALGDIDARFVQQAWHLRPWSAVTPRSFAWQTWLVWQARPLQHWADSCGALASLWSLWRRGLLRGRRGAW